jgi:hypothetical protein
MLHTDITVAAQGARVSSTHAREATNIHQNNQAINQLNRHRRQPAPILHGEGILVMDPYTNQNNFLQEKALEATKQKEEERKKPR